MLKYIFSSFYYSEDKLDGMAQKGLLKSPEMNLMEKVYNILQVRVSLIKCFFVGKVLKEDQLDQCFPSCLFEVE